MWNAHRCVLSVSFCALCFLLLIVPTFQKLHYQDTSIRWGCQYSSHSTSTTNHTLSISKPIQFVKHRVINWCFMLFLYNLSRSCSAFYFLSLPLHSRIGCAAYLLLFSYFDCRNRSVYHQKIIKKNWQRETERTKNRQCLSVRENFLWTNCEIPMREFYRRQSTNIDFENEKKYLFSGFVDVRLAALCHFMVEFELSQLSGSLCESDSCEQNNDNNNNHRSALFSTIIFTTIYTK